MSRNENQKKHWFCFSYKGEEIETGNNVSACTYTGYLYREVTMNMIKENKKIAGLKENAVLIAVSYLGEMTRNEFVEN